MQPLLHRLKRLPATLADLYLNPQDSTSTTYSPHSRGGLRKFCEVLAYSLFKLFTSTGLTWENLNED